MSNPSATILIAEDELLVSLAARLELEEANYTVLEAGDGDKAVEIFMDNYDEIDLVLLDLTMPLMNGDDALAQMRFIVPEIKVILFTGIVADWETLAVDGIIQKPFGAGEILSKVQEILG